MFCNKCGVAIENNIRKCPHCGHFIKIDKNSISYEEKNDIYSQEKLKYNYDQVNYESSGASNIYEDNRYENSNVKNTYVEDLNKYKMYKNADESNISSKLKINWWMFILIFFVFPPFALLYLFIIAISNNTMGKK